LPRNEGQLKRKTGWRVYKVFLSGNWGGGPEPKLEKSRQIDEIQLFHRGGRETQKERVKGFRVGERKKKKSKRNAGK